MTIAPEPVGCRPSPAPAARKGCRLTSLLPTTEHNTIGPMYLGTSFTWFIVGGSRAMLMRGELARPGLQVLSPEQYNLHPPHHDPTARDDADSDLVSEGARHDRPVEQAQRCGSVDLAR